jgi:cyclic lactone autoinducer peptide
MKLKKIMTKVMSAGVLNTLALALVAQSANQACLWFFHQPEFPESANKLKKH